MKTNKNQTGAIEIIILLLVLILGVLAAGYFLLSDNGGFTLNQESTSQEATAPPQPVSESTDIDTIEAELDATVVGDIQSDLEVLDEESSQL